MLAPTPPEAPRSQTNIHIKIPVCARCKWHRCVAPDAGYTMVPISWHPDRIYLLYGGPEAQGCLWPPGPLHCGVGVWVLAKFRHRRPSRIVHPEKNRPPANQRRPCLEPRGRKDLVFPIPRAAPTLHTTLLLPRLPLPTPAPPSNPSCKVRVAQFCSRVLFFFALEPSGT